MKRVLYILLAAVLVASFLPVTAYASSNTSSNLRLIINNQEIVGLDAPPIIQNSRVMVPARAVFEEVGGRVTWNSRQRQITISYGENVLIMTVGQTQAQFNNTHIEIDVPPTIHNGHTLVPLRVAQNFGFYVDWDYVGRAAIVRSPDKSDFVEPESDFYIPEPTSTPDADAHMPTIPTAPGAPTPTPAPPTTPRGQARDVSSAPILPAPNAGTNITRIRSPRETGASAYVIEASSAITDVNHFLLPDNRLVVDIYNAVSSLNGTVRAVSPVSDVRTSQFSRTPNITRVVFELEGAVEYSVSLSYERDILTVAFAANNINSITYNSTTTTDTLHVRGDFQPSVRLSSSGYPRYFTVYLDNASMGAPGMQMPYGVYTSRFVTGQRDRVAYIRVYVEGNRWPAISLTHGTDSVAIVMHRGLTGVRYDFASRELRLSRDVVSMDINQVRYFEEYLVNRYTFTLPAGAAELGLGTLNISDGYIRNVNVRQDIYGNTTIVFETSRVMTFTISETPTDYVITAHLPQEVFPFIVVIDPGHGGRDPGASHHGLVERDLVLSISHMVVEYLNQNPNIRVYMTRNSDVTVANSWRAAFANQMADLYVSIHANAVGGNRPAVNGIETWYMNHSREEALGLSSRQLARNIQRSLINATGATDRGLRSTPNFVVLRDTHMPAALVEVGFLTNREEAAKLACPMYQRRIARAIYEGIVATFESYRPPR